MYAKAISRAFTSRYISDIIPMAIILNSVVLQFLNLSTDESNGETSHSQHSNSSQFMAASSSGTYSKDASF
jgi:hypothetical protein